MTTRKHLISRKIGSITVRRMLDTVGDMFDAECTCGRWRKLTRSQIIRKEIDSCEVCARINQRTAPRRPVLTILTAEQQTVYEAILCGRSDKESRNDALLMVEMATERGLLAEELQFWTAPLPEVELRKVDLRVYPESV